MLVKRIVVHQVLMSNPGNHPRFLPFSRCKLQHHDRSPLKYRPPPLPPCIFTTLSTLPRLSHWHEHRNLQSSVLWVSPPPHLALYTEQLGRFRNIHTTKPFSCLKPLILPIAPGESAKAALWPARQGTGCCLPTYLTSPLPSLWPLC